MGTVERVVDHDVWRYLVSPILLILVEMLDDEFPLSSTANSATNSLLPGRFLGATSMGQDSTTHPRRMAGAYISTGACGTWPEARHYPDRTANNSLALRLPWESSILATTKRSLPRVVRVGYRMACIHPCDILRTPASPKGIKQLRGALPRAPRYYS